MRSLVTLRYKTMGRLLFFCALGRSWSKRLQPERSKHEHGTHPKAKLGTCKLCGQFLVYLQRDGGLQLAFVTSRRS